MTIWEKKNIHLAQKGPPPRDEHICSQENQKKRYRTQNMCIKVPVRMERYHFSVPTGLLWASCRWLTQIALLSTGDARRKNHHYPSTERGTITKWGCWPGGRHVRVWVTGPSQHRSVQVISGSERQETWLHAWKRERWMADVEMEDLSEDWGCAAHV